MYTSVRNHLDVFRTINFQQIPAGDSAVLQPLLTAVLDANNFFDSDLEIHPFLYDIEQTAQIIDEFFLATNDIKALFTYMAGADPSYYNSMVTQEASLQASIDAVMAQATPGFLDYLRANFNVLWEGVEGVSLGFYNAVIAGAGGLGDIFETTGGSLAGVLPSAFSSYTNALGLGAVQAVEIGQFIITATTGLNTIAHNIVEIISGVEPEVAEALTQSSLTTILDMLNAYSEVQEIMTGLPVSEGALYIVNFVSAIADMQGLIEETRALWTAAADTTLSGLSQRFLDDAAWLNTLEGLDIAKDMIGLLMPILNSSTAASVVTYWAEAAVTISDVIAISETARWQIEADRFAAYDALLPLVANYQSLISGALAHADQLSGGTWGTGLTSVLPATALPLNDVFADRYDGALENEPGASGATLALSSSYSGTIGWGDNGDWFVVQLTAGEDYRFTMDGTSLAGTDLALYSSSGVLLARENGALSDSNTSIIEGTATASDTYYLVATSGYTGNYSLSFAPATLAYTTTELADAKATVSTPYSMAVGETFRGNMNSADKDSTTGDWVKVQLTAGQDYRFQLTRGSIYSATIKLYDSLGNLVANANAALATPTTYVIEGTALASGVYYLAVESGYSGSYTLALTTPVLPDSTNELRDAPAGISTPYSMAVGETFRGNMNSADQDSTTGDWVKVQLTAGQDYRFQLTRGSIYSATIKLYDSLGNLVANANAALATPTSYVIEGTALTGGVYYLAVESGYSGSYTLALTAPVLPETTSELRDAPGSIATPYTMTFGETFRGNMNSADQDSTTGDWVKVQLTAGQYYRIEMAKGSIYSAALKLYDVSGALVASQSETLSTTTTSVIQGSAQTSGTYFIAVQSGYSGNYTLRLFQLPPRIDGTSGNDTLLATSTGEQVYGYAGSDTVSYQNSPTGVVVDLLHNTARGGFAAGDSFFAIEHIIGSASADTLAGDDAANGIDGGGGADLIDGQSGSDYLIGGVGDDTLRGGIGNDTLRGGSGRDSLDGGVNADVFYGEGDDDIYVIDNIGDVITEIAGQGSDTVMSYLTYTLGANVENLTLIGAALINGTGNALANRITGNTLANIINGGGGADTLIGGLGNDTYITDGGDSISEAANAGVDTVQSTVTYTLGVNIENLTLIGSAIINGTGNTLANRITGNSAGNILNGGGGADTLIGGLGNDIYITDGGDTIVEATGAGKDTVQSSASHILGVNIENLTLTGAAAINGTGNTLANLIIGNGANNVLSGGGGADTLAGGLGNDTYIIDGGDSINEAVSGGIDLVLSSASFALSVNLEKLTLTGTASINGTGNSLANTILGNAGANAIDGRAGNDTLTGGAGADAFIFTDRGGLGNIDTITDFASGSDKIKLEDAVFTGIGAYGALGATRFVVGTAATDAADRIVYDKATGKLYFDADGSGAGAKVQFAQVTANLTLAHTDFLII